MQHHSCGLLHIFNTLLRFDIEGDEINFTTRQKESIQERPNEFGYMNAGKDKIFYRSETNLREYFLLIFSNHVSTPRRR